MKAYKTPSEKHQEGVLFFSLGFPPVFA